MEINMDIESSRVIPTILSNEDQQELYSDEYPFRLSMRVSGFEGEKDYIKFIRNCEKLIRSCLEYRAWKDYIVNVMGITECSISGEVNSETTVEIHHHLPGLFVLAKAFINKQLEEQKTFSTFDIALRVMEYHFENKVGFCPLIKSLHEKFHNGYLMIPIESVNGNYKHFLENYMGYLDAEDIEVINHRLAIKIENLAPHKWTKDNYSGLYTSEAA